MHFFCPYSITFAYISYQNEQTIRHNATNPGEHRARPDAPVSHHGGKTFRCEDINDPVGCRDAHFSNHGERYDYPVPVCRKIAIL